MAVSAAPPGLLSDDHRALSWPRHTAQQWPPGAADARGSATPSLQRRHIRRRRRRRRRFVAPLARALPRPRSGPGSRRAPACLLIRGCADSPERPARHPGAASSQTSPKTARASRPARVPARQGPALAIGRDQQHSPASVSEAAALPHQRRIGPPRPRTTPPAPPATIAKASSQSPGTASAPPLAQRRAQGRHNPKRSPTMP